MLRLNLVTVAGLVVAGLCVVPAVRGGESPATANVWERVKKAAEAAGGRKAVWAELKKLGPEELLICGRQCCEAYEKAKGRDMWGLVVTANAILSYHQKQVGYEKTARAVGSIIANSDVARWVYGCLEWIENNDHYRHIPEAGMAAIAEGIIESLKNSERSEAAQLVVLRKICSDDILRAMAPADRERVLKACERAGAEAATEALVKQRARSVGAIEGWMKENPDEPAIKATVELELPPNEILELGSSLLKFEQTPSRRQGVRLLGRLQGSAAASRAYYYLARWFEKEPDEALREEIIETALALDKDGSILEALQNRSRAITKSSFWEALRVRGKVPGEPGAGR